MSRDAKLPKRLFERFVLVIFRWRKNDKVFVLYRLPCFL